MPEDNFKEFTINWIVIGLLFFCLTTFAVSFMYSNNPTGLGDTQIDQLEVASTAMENNLLELETNADTILNITANTNPEASELGSRDSVASAYKQKETATSFFASSKQFLAWVFVGELGQMLITIIGGILGFLSIYFLIKWIRTGF